VIYITDHSSVQFIDAFAACCYLFVSDAVKTKISDGVLNQDCGQDMVMVLIITANKHLQLNMHCMFKQDD